MLELNKKTEIQTLIIRKAAMRMRLDKLVEEVARESGQTQERVVYGLMKLRDEGKVMVAEGEPHGGPTSYAFSPISLWFWEAVATVILSVFLVSATSGIALYLRYVFGSVLVLFLPGYSVVASLYPGRALEPLTRLALSIGISLAVVPLVGLILNYSPFGIRLLPVTLTVAGLTMAMLILALARKYASYRATRKGRVTMEEEGGQR